MMFLSKLVVGVLYMRDVTLRKITMYTYKEFSFSVLIQITDKDTLMLMLGFSNEIRIMFSRFLALLWFLS